MALLTTRNYSADRINRMYDAATDVTLNVNAPVNFFDDFYGKTGATVASGSGIWTALDTSSAGDTTPVIGALSGGSFKILLDATEEAQLSGLTFGDKLNFNLDTALIFETKFTITSADMTGITAVWGLATAHNATADSITTNAWFRLQGSLAALIESDDGTTDRDDKTTGVTLVTATSYVFRIECLGGFANYYINGANVTTAGTGTTFPLPASNNLVQPYFALAKASGATLCVLDIDYCRVYGLR